MLSKIISGGQTGADIAAVDAAIACGLPYGGYLPKGRKNEIGTVAATYTHFSELTNGGYPMRTKKNIEESEGTLVFYAFNVSGGTKMTVQHAYKVDKPVCLVEMSSFTLQAVSTIRRWLYTNEITVMNVAGPRGSKQPDMYDYVYSVLVEVIKGRNAAVRGFSL